MEGAVSWPTSEATCQPSANAANNGHDLHSSPNCNHEPTHFNVEAITNPHTTNTTPTTSNMGVTSSCTSSIDDQQDTMRGVARDGKVRRRLPCAHTITQTTEHYQALPRHL